MSEIKTMTRMIHGHVGGTLFTKSPASFKFVDFGAVEPGRILILEFKPLDQPVWIELDEQVVSVAQLVGAGKYQRHAIGNRCEIEPHHRAFTGGPLICDQAIVAESPARLTEAKQHIFPAGLRD